MGNQTDLLLEQQKYCFDSSSIILLRQSYPKDIFKSLHKLITPIFTSGKIIVLNLVLEELKDKERDLFDYIKLNVPITRQEKFENYIQTTQRLIQIYYDGKGKTHNLKADPHVIACAKEENVAAVTEELGSDTTKIPNICGREGVICLNFIEFLKKENIKI